jgi:hypothetical protein
MAYFRVTVTHHIGDLADDLHDVPRKVRAGAHRVLRDNAREGAKLAKGFARTTARRHGRHYPGRITAERAGVLSYEYGPWGHPQGEMSFEWGSRNQPPHLDLNNSADIIGPKMADDIHDMLGEVFW